MTEREDKNKNNDKGEGDHKGKSEGECKGKCKGGKSFVVEKGRTEVSGKVLRLRSGWRGRGAHHEADNIKDEYQSPILLVGVLNS